MLKVFHKRFNCIEADSEETYDKLLGETNSILAKYEYTVLDVTFKHSDSIGSNLYDLFVTVALGKEKPGYIGVPPVWAS